MSDTVVVGAAELERCVGELFQRSGMSESSARSSAADMVLTDLWGIGSHGVLRLPIYLQRLANGAINASPEISTVSARGGFEVLDGDGGMGYVVGHAAMGRAIELAQVHGIGVVTARNSNHFGAAALYARQATEACMLGLAMTNVGPNLVVPGGSKPITGNNPLAFGAPLPRDFPLLLDISMSAVAGGKLLLAMENGESIPRGWATDRQGRPTTDPKTGFEGFLLPLGGHKGFGLSLMIDILSGVIGGGAFQFGINNMYGKPELPSQTSHFLLAIDPEVVMPQAQYLERMDEFASTVKASPMWDSQSAMYLPGEIEHNTRLKRLEHGIPLPASVFDDIGSHARRLDVSALMAQS